MCGELLTINVRLLNSYILFYTAGGPGFPAAPGGPGSPFSPCKDMTAH